MWTLLRQIDKASCCHRFWAPGKRVSLGSLSEWVHESLRQTVTWAVYTVEQGFIGWPESMVSVFNWCYEQAIRTEWHTAFSDTESGYSSDQILLKVWHLLSFVLSVSISAPLCVCVCVCVCGQFSWLPLVTIATESEDAEFSHSYQMYVFLDWIISVHCWSTVQCSKPFL